MKKVILLISVIIAATIISACSIKSNTTDESNSAADGANNNNANNSSDTVDSIDSIELSEILKKITDGITPEELMLDTVSVDAEAFPSFFFTDAPSEDFEAYVSMPMIGSIAHQIAVVRIEDSKNIEALATSVRENADPRKWICAEAEKTAVLTKGNVILIAMSTAEIVDAAVEKFNAL